MTRKKKHMQIKNIYQNYIHMHLTEPRFSFIFRKTSPPYYSLCKVLCGCNMYQVRNVSSGRDVLSLKVECHTTFIERNVPLQSNFFKSVNIFCVTSFCNLNFSKPYQTFHACMYFMGQSRFRCVS